MKFFNSKCEKPTYTCVPFIIDAIVAPDEHRFPPPVLPTGHIGPPPPQAPTGDSSGPGTFPRSKKSHCKYKPLIESIINSNEYPIISSNRSNGYYIVK